MEKTSGLPYRPYRFNPENMKKTIYTAALMLTLIACGNDDIDAIGGNITGGNETGSVTDVIPVTSDLTLELSTDKACYSPNETVNFTATGTLPAGAKVRYRTMNQVVDEQNATSTSWNWTAPSTDFTGYLVDVYRTDQDGTEVILGTIAVDVSSDWTRFPRYGFVATFDDSKHATGVIEEEMAYLNRCHINGVQFQDWHNKHHWPWGGKDGMEYTQYKDIANRDVYTDVVKKYISVQHAYGMKSIFYNLCFGALSDAAEDGVKEEWYVFTEQDDHTKKDAHNLPSGWKSNIYLLDPGNAEWQQYIGDRNEEVYSHLDFDGYQVDQLGGRGDLYDYYNGKVNLLKGYRSFLEAMKTRHPDKRLVMNSVSSYGAAQIAGSDNVDFCYNEVWNDEQKFEDLHTIIKANDLYSWHKRRTVFAAYMNYGNSGSEGMFNNPGVLLTDAVMFALGGSHLELGDHMLGSEYFPNNNLKMNDALKTAMIRYYDFMTAYQNLLRDTDTSAEFTASVSSASSSINAWPPQLGNVTTYARKVGDKEVISLLNFVNADQLYWRDLNGTMPEPDEISSLPLKVQLSGKVKRIWAATPDCHAGAAQELTFEQKDGAVIFTVPSLLYWTMIVIEK